MENDNKLTAREQLELIEALPYAQDREKMLRLMLAEAWHEGWECAYNDGGEDNNAYMTGRELIARREARKADHDAYVLAAERAETKRLSDEREAQLQAEAIAVATGSRGATYRVINPDGSTRAEGSWGEL